MDPVTLIKQYEARLKECEMKIIAILEAIDLECQYTPESYKLVKPDGGDND